MTRLAIAATATLALIGCEQATTTADYSGPCGEVQQIVDAAQGPEPFASLRGEPVMLGDTAVDDKFLTSQKFFGETCETFIMRGMPAGQDMHGLSCMLYSRITGPNEDDLARGTELFEEVSAKLAECVDPALVREETDDSRDDTIDRQVVYKLSDRKPEPGELLIHPIHLHMKYEPMSFGRMSSGFEVKFQFQQPRPEAG